MDEAASTLHLYEAASTLHVGEAARTLHVGEATSALHVGEAASTLHVDEAASALPQGEAANVLPESAAFNEVSASAASVGPPAPLGYHTLPALRSRAYVAQASQRSQSWVGSTSCPAVEDGSNRRRTSEAIAKKAV